jgi:anti-sigma factor RsiW
MTQRIDSLDHLNPDTISAFIDGELPAGEQQGAQQHLNDCHSCALQVLSATQLKAATARAGHRYSPTPETLARLTAQLHSQPQTKKTARIYSIRPGAWVALAAAVLLVVSFLGWRQIHQTNSLAAELLDQHLATLGSGATPQVISTDRHTVKPWFQGRLSFSFNLPDAAALPPDTVLKGADLTYFNGQPAALLLFTIHKHQVSIFLTQRANGPTLTTLPSNHAGFTIDSATTRELCILAVSDVNPADLDLLVVSLVRAQSNT